MMLRRGLFFLGVLTVISSYVSPCFAMTYDNQFFPFGPIAYSRTYDNYSNIAADGFYIFADHARNRVGGEIELFELFGNYDLKDVAHALEITGKPNPLRSQWRLSNIPYRMHGKLESLGIDLAYHQSIAEYLSCGAALTFMNVKTWMEFKPDVAQIPAAVIAGPGDLGELERTRRAANEALGITEFSTNRSGPGDIDAYIRLGSIWHYPEKFRRIDAGIRLGALIPTGAKRDINNPSSIPFAGNGLAGVYLAGDVEFELKEDLKVGLWGRVSQRFSKTMCMRMPVEHEPLNFGALVDTFKLEPGTFFLLSPYLLLQDIREGLGFSIRYLWLHKSEDSIRDIRANRSLHVDLFQARSRSAWIAEYVSLHALYDANQQENGIGPNLSFVFDIPVRLFGAGQVSRSYRVLCGIEVHF